LARFRFYSRVIANFQIKPGKFGLQICSCCGATTFVISVTSAPDQQLKLRPHSDGTRRHPERSSGRLQEFATNHQPHGDAGTGYLPNIQRRMPGRSQPPCTSEWAPSPHS
jgi:hypothetical protein